MKTINPNLLTLLLLLLCNNLFAQSLHIRPEIGVNVAGVRDKYVNPLGKQDYGWESVTRLKSGVYVRIPLAKNIFLEPGLLYAQKGYRKKALVSEYIIDPDSGFAMATTVYTYANTIELPVNLNYDIDLKKVGRLTLLFGPYLGYTFNYSIKRVAGRYEEKYDVITDGKKSSFIEYGLNAGICYQLPLGIYTRVQYGWGIENINTTNGSTGFANRVLGISVGYDLSFKTKKKSDKTSGSDNKS